MHPFQAHQRQANHERVYMKFLENRLHAVYIARTALLLGLCAGAVGMAQAGAIEDLQNFNRDFKSASGNFTQQVKGKSVKSSSGSFVFSRPVNSAGRTASHTNKFWSAMAKL